MSSAKTISQQSKRNDDHINGSENQHSRHKFKQNTCFMTRRFSTISFIVFIVTFAALTVNKTAATESKEDDVVQVPGEVLEELVVETLYKPAPDSEACKKTSQNGMRLKMHYVGWLGDGTKFSSSREDRNDVPIKFTLGAGNVVQGWELGCKDMCTGEKRKLIVPPHLGYGEKGLDPTIPPNSKLIFDVELIEILPEKVIPETFKDIDLDKDNFLSAEEVKRYLWRMAGELEEMSDHMETKEKRQQMFDMIMKTHDLDKDGRLSEEEFYKDDKRRKKDEL